MKRRPGTGERGQSLAELAIFLPVILVIVLIAVDFGRAFFGWVNVTNMVRIGANYASLNPKGFADNDSGTLDRYNALMENDQNFNSRDMTCTLEEPVFTGYELGDQVTVEIECDFTLITPFLDSVLGGGPVPVGATATFVVRSGSAGGLLVNPPPLTPPPTTAPTPTPIATPSPSPTPGASPVATLPPVAVSFYGLPAANQPDALGGGPPGSPNETQIVGSLSLRVQGVDQLLVDFSNTTTGTRVACLWEFGDGQTSTSCDNQLSHGFTARELYDLSLTVNGSRLTRPGYVLVSCIVPDFHDRLKNSAPRLWSDAGFTSTVSTLPGTGNYKIQSQSLVSGQVNPPGGCGASIEVGP